MRRTRVMRQMSIEPGLGASGPEVRNEWVAYVAGDMVERFDKTVMFNWPNNDPEAPGVSVKTVAGCLTATARVTHGSRRFVILEVEGETYTVSPDFTVFVWDEVVVGGLPGESVRRALGR